MQQSYLSAIQQLILQTQTLKSTNRKLTTLCQDLLDNIVQIFKQYFPSIPVYDSDNIYQASQQICKYYQKQLYIIKTEINKNLLYIVNLYGMEIDQQIMENGIDKLQEFINVMKGGKTGLLQQLNKTQKNNRQLQLHISNVEKIIQQKQLQIKRLSIDNLQKQSQIHKLLNINQLYLLENNNIKKQLIRIKDQYQSLQIQYINLQGQFNCFRNQNQGLRRQVCNLEKQRIERIGGYGQEMF